MRDLLQLRLWVVVERLAEVEQRVKAEQLVVVKQQVELEQRAVVAIGQLVELLLAWQLAWAINVRIWLTICLSIKN